MQFYFKTSQFHMAINKNTQGIAIFFQLCQLYLLYASDSLATSLLVVEKKLYESCVFF